MTRPTCATLALGTLKKGVHEYRMHEAAKAEYDHLRETAGERKAAIAAKIEALILDLFG